MPTMVVVVAVMGVALCAACWFVLRLRGRVRGLERLPKYSPELDARLAEAHKRIWEQDDALARLGRELGQLRERLRVTEAHVARAEHQRDQALAQAAALRERLAELEDRVPQGAEPVGPAKPYALPVERDADVDCVVDGADLGALTVRAAAARGELHREQREHRREVASLRMLSEFTAPVLLSAVAAGSPYGPWSRSGAQRACENLAAQFGHFASAMGTDLFGAAQGGGFDGVLRTAMSAVADAVRLVARGQSPVGPPGAAGRGGDLAVETALCGLVSELGGRDTRRHLAFVVGDGVILRLRDGAWDKVLQAPTDARAARLPAAPDALTWQVVESRPGDLLAVCTRSAADLLLREDMTQWYARRWSGREPDLVEFLSHVNVRVRSHGGDRAVVCLWDHGYARPENRGPAARAER
jgi:hypothetical protein